jgi:hypothetical protein
MSKEKLTINDCINDMDKTDKALLALSEIASNLLNCNNSKGDIVENYQKVFKCTIDYAVPLEWSKQVRTYGIDTSQYVWLYDNDNKYGCPVSIGELIKRTYKHYFTKTWAKIL